MSDLSDQERKVLDFVTTKATSFLNVNALILIGSRANRTHTPQSDFDIVIDGRGGPMAWNLLRDAVRNEAPTLAGIDIIAAESIQKQGFFTSIYSQGRFFYGPACSTPAQT
jgi:predicted nucleotidyltransferase